MVGTKHDLPDPRDFYVLLSYTQSTHVSSAELSRRTQRYPANFKISLSTKSIINYSGPQAQIQKKEPCRLWSELGPGLKFLLYLPSWIWFPQLENGTTTDFKVTERLNVIKHASRIAVTQHILSHTPPFFSWISTFYLSFFVLWQSIPSKLNLAVCVFLPSHYLVENSELDIFTSEWNLRAHFQCSNVFSQGSR